MSRGDKFFRFFSRNCELTYISVLQYADYLSGYPTQFQLSVSL